MGLFDGSGAAGDPSFASTAHVARLLDAPVVLVVDAASMSTSVAALVSGFRDYDPSLALRGVVLNRVGSDGHEALLRDTLAPLAIPVLGALRRGDAFRWRDRHLGLVPVVEHADAVTGSIDALGAAVAAQLDLDAILAIAATAPPRPVADPPRARARRCRSASRWQPVRRSASATPTTSRLSLRPARSWCRSTRTSTRHCRRPSPAWSPGAASRRSTRRSSPRTSRCSPTCTPG